MGIPSANPKSLVPTCSTTSSGESSTKTPRASLPHGPLKKTPPGRLQRFAPFMVHQYWFKVTMLTPSGWENLSNAPQDIAEKNDVILLHVRPTLFLQKQRSAALPTTYTHLLHQNLELAAPQADTLHINSNQMSFIALKQGPMQAKTCKAAISPHTPPQVQQKRQNIYVS
jgi:hypothetical protein